MTKPLLKAIEIAGTQKNLALACGVIQPSVSAWLRRGSVPPRYCATIEGVTSGKVTRQDLRPDDFWKIWPDLAHLAPAVKQAA